MPHPVFQKEAGMSARQALQASPGVLACRPSLPAPAEVRLAEVPSGGIHSAGGAPSFLVCGSVSH